MDLVDVGLGFNEVDLYINSGADWSTAMNYFNQDGSPVDLTGYTFASAFRTSFDTPNVAGNITVTVLNAVIGNTMISLDASVSANIPYGTYLYDIDMTDPYNTTIRVMQGTLTLKPAITASNNNVSWI